MLFEPKASVEHEMSDGGQILSINQERSANALLSKAFGLLVGKMKLRYRLFGKIWKHHNFKHAFEQGF